MTTMIRYVSPCAVDGCSRKVHGRSPYCSHHHYRDYAHGHPLQEPIFSYLREPLERLSKWEKTTEGRRAIEAAVSHYVDLAESKLSEWQDDYDRMVRTGVKFNSPHREATEIIAQTYQSKDPRKTVMQLLALGILLEEGEGSFKSDTAFLYEATHVFMRGSAAKAKFKYRASRGGRVAMTRYLRKKTRQALGEFLVQEIVWLGVLMYREWGRKAATDAKAKVALIAAIKGETVSGEIRAFKTSPTQF